MMKIYDSNLNSNLMISSIGYMHVAFLPLLKKKGDFLIRQCPQLMILL